MGNDYSLKPVRAAAIVGTSAMVAGTVLTNSALEDEIIILADFTKGSLTSLQIQIEFSPDNSTWYQEVGTAYSGGTTTCVANVYSLSATGKYRITPIKIKDRYIRISALGVGNGTGSSLKIDAIIGQDV